MNDSPGESSQKSAHVLYKPQNRVLLKMCTGGCKFEHVVPVRQVQCPGEGKQANAAIDHKRCDVLYARPQYFDKACEHGNVAEILQDLEERKNGIQSKQILVQFHPGSRRGQVQELVIRRREFNIGSVQDGSVATAEGCKHENVIQHVKYVPA